MKKSIFTALTLSLLVLTGCGPQSAPQDQATDTGDTLKIGYIGPLTGDAASYGQDEKRAIEMFLEKNPEISGKKVEIIYEDSACDGLKASTAAEKLINVDKVQLILGGVCSGETLAAAPAANKNKVVLFSSTSTSPDITDAGDYVFRNAPSDAKTTDVLSEFVHKDHKKLAILSENTDFAQAYREGLKTKYEKLGGEVVIDEIFNPGTVDFKTVLGKVKDSGVTALASIPQTPTAGGFINKQVKELDINLQIFGVDVHMGDEFFDIAKDTANGTLIVVTSSDKSRPGVQNFFDDYNAKYNREPTIDAYLLLGYDRMHIVKNAIEAVGYDGEKIKNWLYTMPSYAGLAGDTEFDANGDASIKPSLLEAQDGKFGPMSG